MNVFRNLWRATMLAMRALEAHSAGTVRAGMHAIVIDNRPSQRDAPARGGR